MAKGTANGHAYYKDDDQYNEQDDDNGTLQLPGAFLYSILCNRQGRRNWIQFSTKF